MLETTMYLEDPAFDGVTKQSYEKGSRRFHFLFHPNKTASERLFYKGKINLAVLLPDTRDLIHLSFYFCL